jgi:hypothetical protein
MELGGTVDDVMTILGKAQSYLPLILDIVSDPALPEVVQKVRTIQSLAVKPAKPAKTAPGTTPPAPGTPPAPAKPPAKPPGIGLRRFLPAMDATIWYLRHPWAPWVIGGGVVIVLAGGGYAIGRWSGKRAARKASPALGRWRARRPRRPHYRGSLG